MVPVSPVQAPAETALYVPLAELPVTVIAMSILVPPAVRDPFAVLPDTLPENAPLARHGEPLSDADHVTFAPD